MNATSPKSSLAKLGLCPRPKTLKIMILGQGGVGKSGKYNNNFSLQLKRLCLQDVQLTL